MRHLRAILLLIAAGIVAAACNAGNPPPAESEGDYATQIQSARAALDQMYRNQPDKPVPAAKMNEFLPLKYFPPDPEYVVPASLNPSKERIVVEMPTSQGKIRKHQRVGVLEFTLKGQPLTLGAFVEAGAGLDRLFVPFSDMTSGTETYAAGRYLELDRTRVRRLHDRLQQGLLPILLLQPRLRLPDSTAREPASAADSCRRAPALNARSGVL